MEITPVETQGLKDREAANIGQHRRPIVALGAEQGGLRPVQQFLAEMPSDCGMAFVVILRQPDGSVADLVASLQPQSSLPLIQVDARTPVEMDHVYVVSPDHQVVMEDGTIDVVERARPEHEVAPIDLLFRTLAEAHGPDTAAVVLSGTGADGAMGLQRIKEMGGLTLAQDPADAEVSEMPRHAVATGMVDVILPAAELPAKLIDYWQRADVVRIPHEEVAEPLDEDVLREVFALVRLRTGHDFSQYKRSTILRRLARRMQVTHADTMAAYIALLRGSLDETRALLRDFLISVTNFFRDREAWEALETIVPPLFSGKTAEDQVRVWVTGCATGEEAYSVAILLHEYAATLDEPPTIQVFATDIDDDAIAAARQGRYSETIAVDVEPARLRRYFVAEPGHFRVKQEIRDLVLFASHNILRDPPFSRLDMVTCRNVLIYLNRAVQDQVLRLFHFGMLPDGYLLLGSSESTEGVPDLFAPVDRSLRLFQRRSVLTSSPLVMSDQSVARTRRPRSAPPVRDVDGQRPSFATLHERLLLDHLPPSILVTGDFDIVHVAAGAGQFLQFAEGEPSHNLLEVAIPELRLELRTAFFASQQDGGDTITRRIPIKHDGRELIEIVVRPIQEPAWAEGFYLIVFREIAEISEIVRPAGDDVEPMVRQIEDELQRTQNQLRLTVEQYETAVEEYRAANEELQAINEEARATSEELETSKEELQSANEELSTLNQALKHSLEESQQTSNDLHNLITATQIGTIFLDRDLRIKLFTPAAQSLFNLIPADIYRPLHHITHRLIYHELIEDAERVCATPEPVQREVASVDGRWYLARLLPYRTGDGTVTGIVLTFVDITERKRDELDLRERAELLTLAQRVAGAGFWSITPDTRTTFITNECRELVGFRGNPDVSGLEQWIDEVCHPDDRDLVRQARDAAIEGERELDLEFRILLEERGERWILLRSRRVSDRDGHVNNIVGMTVDISERKRREAELERLYQTESEARARAEEAVRARDQFLSIASHELRTPLTTVQGYASMLERRARDAANNPARTERIVNTIVRQTERLNALIEQLLDASRLQRGQFELERHPLDLGDLVSRSADDYRLVLPAEVEGQPVHAIVLDRGVDHLAVLGDANRLEEVLQNLLNNAVKYSPEGGEIQVRLRRESSDAILEVEDHGVGIDEEALPHLAEPFYRVKSEDRGDIGFGIGLFVVDEIVKRHGGRVEVESVPGDGSTFRVILPLIDAAE